jgi:hypothetical protein
VSGAVPFLPPYAFMTWTGTTLPILPFTSICLEELALRQMLRGWMRAGQRYFALQYHKTVYLNWDVEIYSRRMSKTNFDRRLNV